MKRVINELYYGEISPAETETPRDEKYRRTVNRVDHEIEELAELLTKEQYAKLEHLLDIKCGNIQYGKQDRNINLVSRSIGMAENVSFYAGEDTKLAVFDFSKAASIERDNYTVRRLLF